MTEQATNQKLSEYAYEKIEHAIISARLDFGEPLSENALAVALNVSKAPVRTALLELQRKGLVEIVPQSGCYVATPSRDQVLQLLDIRVLLETSALKSAMKNDAAGLIEELQSHSDKLDEAFQRENWSEAQFHDTAFHKTIIMRSNNQYILQSYENIVPLMKAMMRRFMLTQQSRNKSLIDHQRIVASLVGRDITSANRILRKHILKNANFQSAPRWPDKRASRAEYADRDFSKVFDV